MAVILTYDGKVVTHDGQVVSYDAIPKDVWLKCSDDSAAAIYALADSHRPTQNFAWIFIGGIYIKCYRSGSTLSASTGNPCSVQDPSGTPTQCSDIIPDWFSDAFPGVALNDCKWNQSGSPTITVNDNCRMQYPGSGVTHSIDTKYRQWDQSVTFEIDFSSLTLARVGGVANIVFRVDDSGVGSNFYQAYLQLEVGDRRWWKTNNNTDGVVEVEATAATSGTMKIVVSASDIKFYVGGVLKDTSSSSFTPTRCRAAVESDNSGNTVDVIYDNFVVTDN